MALANIYQTLKNLLSMYKPGPFFTKRGKDGVIQVQLNGKYEIKQNDQLYEVIEYLIEDINEKNNEKIFDKLLDVKFFSSIEFKLGKCKMEDQKCTICLCEFEIKDFYKQITEKSEQDIYALPCSHYFHFQCLKNMIGKNKWVKCPICTTIFGKMIGDMPQGKMSYHVDQNMKCEGYGPGTIIIQYNMYGCVKNGIKVPGTSRIGYLPNTPEGRQVLELFKQCFERKLTFTIGRSVTTGADNQIVWNGIHHKTALNGGSSHFGYPDSTYLKRVKEELAAKGIVPQKNEE